MPPASPYSAHIDTFTRDRLPPPHELPEFLFELPELQFPDHLNCATELLDRWVERGAGQRLCVQGHGVRWSYAEFQAQANRIARVLVEDLGLLAGNRVLLRGANSPMLAACWFAVVKAGGVAVGSMPLLRARELVTIIDKAQVSHALCDARLADELNLARPSCPTLKQALMFGGAPARWARSPRGRQTRHFRQRGYRRAGHLRHRLHLGHHRRAQGHDALPPRPHGRLRLLAAACAACRARRRLHRQPAAGLHLRSRRAAAVPAVDRRSTVLVEKATPDALLTAIAQFRASVCFTAPTSYRAMAAQVAQHDIGSLRKCVSAGEALPAATRQLWHAATGIQIIDGIGSTELLHIFISADEQHARPGVTGVPVPGYRACILGDDGRELPRGQVGRLAVKGPTGCRYLDDPRQANYVRNGWNLTGDAYLVDDDGQFVYQARTDDMIISGGYNIAGPEVESALLLHPAVAECGVIGQPDEARGMVVKAFVVLRPGFEGDAALVKALQEFVKQTIAPYKYPRQIEFRASLPRTETGKLQRFRLREPA